MSPGCDCMSLAGVCGHSDSHVAAWQKGKAQISPPSSGSHVRLGLGPSLLLSELHQHILPHCVACTQLTQSQPGTNCMPLQDLTDTRARMHTQAANCRLFVPTWVGLNAPALLYCITMKETGCYQGHKIFTWRHLNTAMKHKAQADWGYKQIHENHWGKVACRHEFEFPAVALDQKLTKKICCSFQRQFTCYCLSGSPIIYQSNQALGRTESYRCV